MADKSSSHAALATELKRAECALNRHDQKIVWVKRMQSGLIYSIFASCLLFALGAVATMFGGATGLHTYMREDDPAYTPLIAPSHSWMIAKSGLGGLLGGFILMTGFGFGAEVLGRRYQPLSEKRYQLYLAHENLREKFNTQAQQPPPVHHEPRVPIRLQQPVTLSVTKRTFKGALRPQA